MADLSLNPLQSSNLVNCSTNPAPGGFLQDSPVSAKRRGQLGCPIHPERGCYAKVFVCFAILAYLSAAASSPRFSKTKSGWKGDAARSFARFAGEHETGGIPPRSRPARCRCRAGRRPLPERRGAAPVCAPASAIRRLGLPTTRSGARPVEACTKAIVRADVGHGAGLGGAVQIGVGRYI